jgi:hypothetical protein
VAGRWRTIARRGHSASRPLTQRGLVAHVQGPAPRRSPDSLLLVHLVGKLGCAVRAVAVMLRTPTTAVAVGDTHSQAMMQDSHAMPVGLRLAIEPGPAESDQVSAGCPVWGPSSARLALDPAKAGSTRGGLDQGQERHRRGQPLPCSHPRRGRRQRHLHHSLRRPVAWRRTRYGSCSRCSTSHRASTSRWCWSLPRPCV